MTPCATLSSVATFLWEHPVWAVVRCCYGLLMPKWGIPIVRSQGQFIGQLIDQTFVVSFAVPSLRTASGAKSTQSGNSSTCAFKFREDSIDFLFKGFAACWITLKFHPKAQYRQCFAKWQTQTCVVNTEFSQAKDAASGQETHGCWWRRHYVYSVVCRPSQVHYKRINTIRAINTHLSFSTLINVWGLGLCKDAKNHDVCTRLETTFPR